MLQDLTVTAVCGTCHNIYQRDPTGAFIPGYPGTSALEDFDDSTVRSNPANQVNPGESRGFKAGRGLPDPARGYLGDLATASPYDVYDVPDTEGDSHEGHRLGLDIDPWTGLVSIGTYDFGDCENPGSGDPGCGENANYIPGGTQSITRLISFPLDSTEAANTVANYGPMLGDSSTGGLYCAGCHGPHGEQGQVLPAFIYTNVTDNCTAGTVIGDARPKLLSKQPNHQDPEFTGGLESSGVCEDPLDLDGDGASDDVDPTPPDPNNYINDVSSYLAEGGYWCARCHDKRLGTAFPNQTGQVSDLNSGQHYNHPSSVCLECHGNYGGETGDPFPVDSGYDFPHTSEASNLLLAFPDELCKICHGPTGSLPLP